MDRLTPVIAQIEVTSGSLLLLGVLSLLAGILIFVVPRVLNYVVAAYLILVGIVWIIVGL